MDRYPVRMLGAMLVALVSTLYCLYQLKEEPEKAAPPPVGYRYLQKCEDGVTVEYRSFKKLPKLHVCGE